MSVAILTAGTIFNRSISHTEIDQIKNAKHRNDVESIWGKIADFFCGTKKEEAKLVLFDVYDMEKKAHERIGAFSRLHDLVSPEFKDNFGMKLCDGNILLTVNNVINETLDLAEDTEDAKKLLLKIKTEYGNDSIEERIIILKEDILRANYIISIKNKECSYSPDDVISDEIKKQAVDDIIFKCSEHQRKDLGILATQSLTLAMKNCKDGDYGTIGSRNHRQEFTIKQFPSGDIMLDMRFKNTVPDNMLAFKNDFNIIYDKVTYDASFIIGKNETRLLSCKWTGDNNLSKSQMQVNAFNEAFENAYLKDGNNYLFKYCIEHHLDSILGENTKLGNNLEKLRDNVPGESIGADDGMECLEFLHQNENTFFKKNILNNYEYIENELSSLSEKYCRQNMYDESDKMDFMKQRLINLKLISSNLNSG